MPKMYDFHWSNAEYMNPSRATIPLIRPHQCDSDGGRIRGVLLYHYQVLSFEHAENKCTIAIYLLNSVSEIIVNLSTGTQNHENHEMKNIMHSAISLFLGTHFTSEHPCYESQHNLTLIIITVNLKQNIKLKT